MTSSHRETWTVPERVFFDDSSLHVVLRSGDRLSASLSQFPRLLRGTAAQRNDWRIVGAGAGIHWPLLDEDISIAGLRRNSSETTVQPETMEQILAIVGSIFEKSEELSRLSGRHFTPDGLFVSTTGQVVCEYIYGLLPPTEKSPFARTRDGRTVKVALTGRSGNGFAIRWTKSAQAKRAQCLICLQLSHDGFREVYNGEFPVQLLQEYTAGPAGQVKLSMKMLAEMNPALIDKEHSFASINRLLVKSLYDAA